MSPSSRVETFARAAHVFVVVNESVAISTALSHRPQAADLIRQATWVSFQDPAFQVSAFLKLLAGHYQIAMRLRSTHNASRSNAPTQKSGYLYR